MTRFLALPLLTIACITPESDTGPNELVDSAVDTGIVEEADALPPCEFIDVNGESTYAFCAWPLSATEATTFCADYGMHLVIVDSWTENAWILERTMQVAPGEPFWHGLSDVAQEGVWRWPDGSLPEVDMWHWGEPNNAGNEDCAVFRRANDGTWNDVPCTNPHAFVCEG